MEMWPGCRCAHASCSAMCAQALCADRFKCVNDNADEQYRQLVLTINGAYVTGRSVQAG